MVYLTVILFKSTIVSNGELPGLKLTPHSQIAAFERQFKSMSAGNIGGLIAVALTPILIAYAHSLALRHYGDGKHFRLVPVVRGLYFSGLIMFGWAIGFYLYLPFSREDRFGSGDWLGAILSAFFLGMTICSWPGTAVLETNGLSWRRMFRLRRFYSWESIDDVGPTMDESDSLVIYLKDGSQLSVSRFVEDWPRLSSSIKKHLRR